MNSKMISTDSAHEDIKANVTDMNSKGTTPFSKITIILASNPGTGNEIMYEKTT